MADDWKLTLEDFGRIARAEVEVKRFTVLVGPNNTGKSYLASLIWGVEGGGLEPQTDGSVAEVFEGWAARSRALGGTPVSWTDDERRVLNEAWRRDVGRQVTDLCRRVFDEEGIAPKAVQIEAPGFARDGALGHDGEDVTLRRPELEASFGAADLPAGWWHGRVMRYLTGFSKNMLREEYRSGDAIFLPASRTGFSLFRSSVLGELASAALRQSARPLATRFTLPQIHLLHGLTFAFGGKRGWFAHEADLLERTLDGRIINVGVGGTAVYRFLPDGLDQPIGLQLSSALVTELMPLVVALRHAQALPFLVVEEPEAHLHPRVQREVIRCLARLVRRGVRVLITTHSTTVAQQINNLVKLGTLDPAEREAFAEYGYGPDDYLTADEVAVHQCVLGDDRRTVVTPIEPGLGGFPMPTFNALLGEVAEETRRLYEALDPGDEG